MITVAQALKQAQTLLDESRSGEILLGFVLKKSRAYLYTYPEKPIEPDDFQLFQTLIRRRQQGEPIAYLIGEKEFYSLHFKVTPDTLIPRPETELIIDQALQLLPDTFNKILELGTGSGAIAVTLAQLRPQWQVFATDISAAALDIAQYNAQQYQLKNIDFLLSNWFQEIPKQQFNLIISNPPYIAEQDEHLQDLRYEPLSALQAGERGLDDLEIIIQAASDYLCSHGYLLLEHGYDQQQAVQDLLHQAKFVKVTTVSDLAGLPRISLGQKPC
jgi:release factor glutamine methyltransferase